jgi:porphobilinogen deaminase
VPVGAFAVTDENEPEDGRGGAAALRVSGLVASGDGRTLIRMARRGDDPEAVGAALARALLAGGGAAIDGFSGGVATARDTAP